jgi:hypothetical protein
MIGIASVLIGMLASLMPQTHHLNTASVCPEIETLFELYDASSKDQEQILAAIEYEKNWESKGTSVFKPIKEVQQFDCSNAQHPTGQVFEHEIGIHSENKHRPYWLGIHFRQNWEASQGNPHPCYVSLIESIPEIAYLAKEEKDHQNRSANYTYYYKCYKIFVWENAWKLGPCNDQRQDVVSIYPLPEGTNCL